MSESYEILRKGIDEKINIHIKQIENRKGFSLTVDKLNTLKEKMRSELMPKYKEDGYVVSNFVMPEEDLLEIDTKFLSRSLNEGFSGGEKKLKHLLKYILLQRFL